jgi:hypothetical protein
VKKNFNVGSRKGLSLSAHNSHVWDISSSPLHCIIASVGSNGTAMVKPFADEDLVYAQKDKVWQLRTKLFTRTVIQITTVYG